MSANPVYFRLAVLTALAVALAGCGDARGTVRARRAEEPPKVYVERPVGESPPSTVAATPVSANQAQRSLVGDGRPFNMTGAVPCTVVAGDDDDGRSCSIGIIRTAPGAAEVWIAIGEGRERHITFANGQPVRSNGAGALSVETEQGRHKVHVGSELYEIPVAVISGATNTPPTGRPARRPTPRAEAPPEKAEAPAAPAPAPAPAAPAEAESPPI